MLINLTAMAVVCHMVLLVMHGLSSTWAAKALGGRQDVQRA
jgi:hypothetical protein